MQCGTGDGSILECFSSPLLSYNCTQNDLAGVRCEGLEVTLHKNILLLSHFSSWPSVSSLITFTAPCNDGDIRLAGGNVSNEGRVEVCLGNTWATVCDDGWANNDASVACGQLGYQTQGQVPYEVPST